MIVEYADKNDTRSLYEEAFEDSREFVDYYYSEKCTDNRIIVSIEDGKILSMLHLNPYYVNLCGTIVKSYYVVAVATKKEYRHQGHMARIFEKTFELLKTEKIPFVFLMPVDEAIYSWMGFKKICDFSLEEISNFEDIVNEYDIYCIRDEKYIRRMHMEEKLRAKDQGEVLPDNPIIMAKITHIDAFNSATDQSFCNEKDALEFLKTKKIYICEEV